MSKVKAEQGDREKEITEYVSLPHYIQFLFSYNCDVETTITTKSNPTVVAP